MRFQYDLELRIHNSKVTFKCIQISELGSLSLPDQ